MASIGAVVHAGDEGVVLFFRGGKTEGVDAPLICCAHQLVPAPLDAAALGH